MDAGLKGKPIKLDEAEIIEIYNTKKMVDVFLDGVDIDIWGDGDFGRRNVLYNAMIFNGKLEDGITKNNREEVISYIEYYGASKYFSTL